LMLENPSLHSQFIMVSTVTDVPNVFNYYVGVPSQTFFADFDGFIIVDESDLRRPSRSYQCVWAYGSARLTLETRTPQGFWQDAPRHARRAGAFYSSCATTPGAGPRHHQCPRSGALAGRSMSDKSMTPSRTFLPPSSESTEQSSLDWAVSIETWRPTQGLPCQKGVYPRVFTPLGDHLPRSAARRVPRCCGELRRSASAARRCTNSSPRRSMNSSQYDVGLIRTSR
jgi:hypothetical protein